MKMGGYAGTILEIDLTDKSIKEQPLDRALITQFIGPEGISFRFAYDLISPKMDPYAERSPIIIGTGPIVGAPVPASSRVFATFKHPCYGGVVENAHAGGDLGPMLKWAGYDYIIITGKSDKPVYLNIYNDEVTICDGRELWGKDTFEATNILWEAHDNPSVLTYGPAGERLAKLPFALLTRYTPWAGGCRL